MIKTPNQLPLSKDYLPPLGEPSVTDINQRTMNAVNRLQVRGMTPQPNPLVTSFQVAALVGLLVDAGLIKNDDFLYRIAKVQMEDLERIANDMDKGKIVVPVRA